MKVIAGSYTQEVCEGLSGNGKGISVFNFDTETGKLRFLFSEYNINTSYISIHKNLQLLYTCTEVSAEREPQLLCYKIQEHGLQLIHQLPITGGLPCHIELITDRTLGIACYETGNSLIFNLDCQGVPQHDFHNIQHLGSGPNKLRQEGPHAHQIYYNKLNANLFIPDLGLDKVIAYKMSGNKSTPIYDIDIPKGNGPRHMAIHPSGQFAFIANEMAGTLTLCKLINKQFIAQHTIVAQSLSLRDRPASASAVQLSKDGRFVYIGLRTGNQIGIAEFNHKKESLTLIAHQSSLGITPREFIITPCGKWLIVANQDSENIISFEINEKNGSLKARAEIAKQKSIVCLKLL